MSQAAVRAIWLARAVLGVVAGCAMAVLPGWAEVEVVGTGPGSLRLAYTARAGEPLGTCLAGIPAQGEVRLEVIEAREGKRLAPAEVPADWSGLRLEGPVFLGEVGWVREQRAVAVGFGPRRGVDGSVRTYDRVVAELRFDGDPVAVERSIEDRWSEELYRGVLVNYAQARGWRRHRPRLAAKAAQGPASGSAVKLSVREEGLYCVRGADLQALGVSLSEVMPSRLRLWYAGGTALPMSLVVLPPAEYREAAIVVEDGGDGRFDPGDYLLFYGQPVDRWEWNQATGQHVFRRNLYTRDNLYWLSWEGEDGGRRAAGWSGAVAGDQAQQVATCRARIHAEQERNLLVQVEGINSGLEWYWEEFRGNARNFQVELPFAVPDTVDLRVRFYGVKDQTESYPTSRFRVRWNNQIAGDLSFRGSASVTVQVRIGEGVAAGANQLGLFHSAQPARLDWYELEYTQRLAAQRGELAFDGPVGEGLAQYQLGGFGAERPRLFAVSGAWGLAEVVGAAYDSAAGTVVFQDRLGPEPGRYLAVTGGAWKQPVRLALDRGSGLRAQTAGAEYVVLAPAAFARAAAALAWWRGVDDRFGAPLSTQVVAVEDVYDEFSGGLVDPAAIRSFVHWAVGHWQPAPFFVVLLGDGTYDYKNNSGTSPGNWMPPFEDGDSTYDEWYVRLDGDPYPDLAIGRVPVQSAAEAEGVVAKLIQYDRAPEPGPWQARVLLIADDLRNPEKPNDVERYFLMDAEHMAKYLLPPALDQVKLYLGENPLEGRTKPRAREAFLRRFNEGAAIVTYLGHGNPEVLAHEQMFVLSRDEGAIANQGRLPFFYTAASQVGVFDDPLRQSIPEAFLNRLDGGVIGMISATRVGFHLSNMVLARQFHEQMYRSGREHVPVGLALMEAKQLVDVLSQERRNIQRYSLFGDPAQRLVEPRYRVALEAPDTLRALAEVEVAGQVLDAQGQSADSYAGQVLLRVFDSAVTTQLDGLPYEKLGSTLFRGVFPVAGGRFRARLRVPKDITYQGQRARVSAYAWSGPAPAAFGSVDGLFVRGTAPGVAADEEGPRIRLGFAGQAGFASGDRVGPTPVLEAVLEDESGINVTAETGHEIELRVDDQVFAVTESFSCDGDYRRGVLRYPLPALEPGAHAIRLKAWDSFNNSTWVEAQVQVAEAGDFGLSDVLFHPNPLQQHGWFTYALSAPAVAVRIRVYTLAGRLVADLEGGTSLGYNQVPWEPAAALANGSYLYRIAVRGPDGQERGHTAALVLLR